jgi:hypothetical protein
MYRLLIVNVPELIYNIYQDPSSKIYQDLKSTFGRKKLRNEGNVINESQRIYYEFNPIHFSPKVVNEIIKSYISKHSSEIEESNNMALLLGYFNYDLLQESDLAFNLPLLEIQSLCQIGNIISYIELSYDNLPMKESEVPKELDQPKPIVKVKVKENADGGDGDGGDDGGDADNKDDAADGDKEPELNEDGTPKIIFHPEKYKWTFTDGSPRNYLQHLSKMFVSSFETLQEEVKKETLQEVVMNSVISKIVKDNMALSNNFISGYFQDDKVLAKDVKKPKIVVSGKIILLLVK